MNMKKVVVLMCVVMMGANTLAYTLIGPPTAELQITTQEVKGTEMSHREDRHGYIFSFSKMDVGIQGIGSLEDVEFTRHYYNWSIALGENFNFGLLLGAASADADSDLSEISDFNGDNGFSYGFNLKCTFHHGEIFDLGTTIQMTWFSSEDSLDVDIPGFFTGNADVDFDDAYDLQVAVGPTVDMGGWKLYGGALYYLLEGDLDVSVSGVGSASFDIDEDDAFCGFVGAQFDFYKNTDVIVEYILGNNSYGVNAGVGVTF